MSIPVGDQKELLGTLSKSGCQGRILLDRSVGDHSVPAAPAITPTILQVELNYLSLSFLYFNHHPTIVQLDLFEICNNVITQQPKGHASTLLLRSRESSIYRELKIVTTWSIIAALHGLSSP